MHQHNKRHKNDVGHRKHGCQSKLEAHFDAVTFSNRTNGNNIASCNPELCFSWFFFSPRTKKNFLSKIFREGCYAELKLHVCRSIGNKSNLKRDAVIVDDWDCDVLDLKLLLPKTMHRVSIIKHNCKI
jgi:hypothetical protein